MFGYVWEKDENTMVYKLSSKKQSRMLCLARFKKKKMKMQLCNKLLLMKCFINVVLKKKVDENAIVYHGIKKVE